jgi:hypothetical protein
MSNTVKVLLARNVNRIGISDMDWIKVLVSDDRAVTGDLVVYINPRNPGDRWDLFRMHEGESQEDIKQRYDVFKVIMILK